VFDDAGKKVDPAPDVLLFIKFDFHLAAANETDAIFRDDPSEMAAAVEVEDAGDLLFVEGGVAEVVQAKQFGEGVLAFVDQGEVVQGKMGDKTPEHPSAGGLTKRDDPLDGTDPLQLEVAGFVAEREAIRQIAIGAGAVDGDGIDVGAHGAAGKVHKREVDLRALVVASLRRPAAGVPERLLSLLLTRSGVAKAIEGLELNDFMAFAIGGDDFVDGED